jgi:hypothetical protein
VETNAPDDGLSDFISVRPHLFGISTACSEALLQKELADYDLM